MTLRLIQAVLSWRWSPPAARRRSRAPGSRGPAIHATRGREASIRRGRWPSCPERRALTNGTGDRKARPDCGWSMSPPARSSRSPASRGPVSRPGRPARRRCRPRLSPAIKRVYLTYSEPWPNGSSGAGARLRAGWSSGRRPPRLDGFTVIWRDPQAAAGRPFGARIAFAPDGKSLFLSSGERQQFTPAQDPSQPTGQDPPPDARRKAGAGKSAGGQYGRCDRHDHGSAGGHGCRQARRRQTARMARAEYYSGRNLEQRPPQSAGPRLRARRPAVGNRNGPARRRRAQPDPAGPQLRLARVSNGSNYDGVPTSPIIGRRRVRGAQGVVEPVDQPGLAADLHRRSVPAVEGRCPDRGAVGPGADPRRHRGDQASKADQWDMGARIRAVDQGPDGEVYLLEDGPRRAAAAARAQLRRGGSANNRAAGPRAATWRRSGSRSSRPTVRGNRAGVRRAIRTAATWRCMTISAQVEIGRIVGRQAELAAGLELGREQIDRPVVDHPPLGMARLGPRVGVQQIEEAERPVWHALQHLERVAAPQADVAPDAGRGCGRARWRRR